VPFGIGPIGSIGFFEVLPTTISPGLVILASPQITSTLFFFIRKPTPLFMRWAMPRERSTIPLMSGVIVPSSLRP